MNTHLVNLRCTSCAVLVAVLVLSGNGVARAGVDEGDVIVARSAANQLRIDGYNPDSEITVLEPSGGLFNGWTGTEPGFDHLVVEEPENDLFTLQSGCQIRLELVAADPAFRAITNTFAIIDDPGERALLGGAALHAHLTWHVNSDHASFDPLKVLWRATFKLVDTGTTGYAESSAFTFHFATVDCTRGDCNGDTVIDGRDVAEFVATVLDPTGRTDEDRCRADTNRDGYATVEDVESFVGMLLAIM